MVAPAHASDGWADRGACHSVPFATDLGQTHPARPTFAFRVLENMYHSSEIDENVESTSKLIDKIMKNDEKNITSKNKLIDFPDSKNNVMYDDTIKKRFYKKLYF